MPKKLLFVSSANLTVNPRLLKELRYAVELGYEVDFVGFNLGNWSDEIDKELVKNIKANFHYIPITRKPFLSWFFSSVLEKISKKIYPFFKNSLKLNAYAHSKRSILLNKYIKKNKKKYDLIIAHTLPSLYPAFMYSKKTKTNFTFDIEDYHPGENSSDKIEKSRRELLMKTMLPQASFVTYAAPLIGEQSLKLCNNTVENHKLINNCFSEKEFQFKENNSEKIKFVWFSQNIAARRGLELILPALEKYKEKVELHLIGNLYQNFYHDYLSEFAEIIKIHAPLSQKELNLKLSEFDIGLAIELNTADFNRQICLTNKIWAYLQSGLYILATNTPAQIDFLKKFRNHGFVSKQDELSFEKGIENIISNIESIRTNKKLRFDNSKENAWEFEKLKLNTFWEN